MSLSQSISGQRWGGGCSGINMKSASEDKPETIAKYLKYYNLHMIFVSYSCLCPVDQQNGKKLIADKKFHFKMYKCYRRVN